METARGTVAKPKYANELESMYAVALDARTRSGEIAWWGYGCWRFELGSGAWYRPDFPVMLWDGLIEVHETKGFMREAARLRLLMAMKLYPMFRWRIVKRTGPLGFELFEPT